MGQLSDAVSDIINTKRQKGLDDANLKWQQELQDRQRKQWADEDAGKAAIKEANEAAAKHLSDRLGQQGDQAQPPAPSLADAAGPSSLDQPVSVQAPPQVGQGLTLASAQPPGAPGASADGAAPADPAPAGQGLADAQPAAPAPPADQTGAGQSMMAGGGVFSKPQAMPKAAAPEKVSEGQAIFEAATKRGEVLLKHGRYDDFMANHAKQAEIGTQLLAQAAQRGDAAYAQTGDPTVYLKEMSQFANTGVHFVGAQPNGVNDAGKPVWTVNMRSDITGQDVSHDMTGDEIMDGVNRMRDPKYAQQVALKGAVAQVQARAKMAEQDNETKNKKGLQDAKSADDRDLEGVKQKGRLAVVDAETRGRMQVKDHSDKNDDRIKPKDQIASIDSERKDLKDQRQALNKDYQAELKDPNLDDNQRANLRQAYERQVREVNDRDKVLAGRRDILYRGLKLVPEGGDGAGAGLSSAKGPSAPAKVSGTKGVASLRSDAAAAIASGKDPKAVAARFQQMTGQAY